MGLAGISPMSSQTGAVWLPAKEAFRNVNAKIKFSRGNDTLLFVTVPGIMKGKSVGILGRVTAPRVLIDLGMIRSARTNEPIWP
jgi:hypothetical protein